MNQWKVLKQDRITAKDNAPLRFLYLRETKSWWCEEGGGEGGGEEKVHLLTHATTRGMGKKTVKV